MVQKVEPIRRSRVLGMKLPTLTKTMKTFLTLPSKAGGLRSALVVAVGLVAIVVLSSASFWGSSSRERKSERRALPPGQLQADMRTFAAAFSFLLDSDTPAVTETPSATTSMCVSNFAIPLAPSTSLCCVSNQADLPCELSTNFPTRG